MCRLAFISFIIPLHTFRRSPLQRRPRRHGSLGEKGGARLRPGRDSERERPSIRYHPFMQRLLLKKLHEIP